jgi:malate dehydrogenase (oxaloacetate-decarboxylating)
VGKPICDHRLVVAGAGSAGIGIVRQVRAAMIADGLTEAEARSRILVTDSKGLVVAGNEAGNDFKREVASDPALVASLGLAGDNIGLEGSSRRSPSVLVGVPASRRFTAR